ncbi:MAG TPA: DinB family protein [Thermomicrobiales bacterium]|nr:DinB family protein [Thermomicrobiales bacterium]
MANSDLIDSLIATYRNLNMTIRPMSDTQVEQATSGGKSLREMIVDMRDHEMQTSQQLKLMSIGEGALSGGMPEILPSAPGISIRSVLSEFGTAREAILALIRELSDGAWAAEHDGPNGRTTIQAFIEQLVAHDREALSQIEPLLKAPAA